MGQRAKVKNGGKLMKKKVIGLALGALLFALSVSAQAQQAGKVPRIGYLDNSTASGRKGFLEAFRQELTKLGWIEGKNITIEYRFAEQRMSACLSLRRTWFVLRLI
jgi:hypothetical protein